MAAGAMAAMYMASALLMLMPTTEAGAMEATDTESALLTPLPTTAGEAMAATATESRFLQSTAISNCLDLNLYWKAKFLSFPPENCDVRNINSKLRFRKLTNK